MAANSSTGLSLIFSWRKPPTTLAVLGSFLVLSTLIHAMGFYVFHVVYQPAVSLPPSPSHLTIIDPASPAAAPFLAWLDSEDPALTFLPDPVAPDLAALAPRYQSSISLFNTERLSSFAPLEPSLKPSVAIARLIPKPITALHRQRSSTPETEKGQPSRSSFAEIRFDRLKPAAEVVLPVQEASAAPAEFMLGIDRSGNVMYLLAVRTTGSDAVDKELAARLRSLVFPADPARPETFWETARISWHLQPRGEAE